MWIFVLILLMFVYAVVEWILIHALSDVCPRIGLPIKRLSGPLPGGLLPGDLPIRLAGVVTRGLPDGRLLIRPRSWWEKGPSADPTMRGTVGVLHADPQRWVLEVRTGIGPQLLVAVGGALAWENWISSLAWFAFCATFFGFAVRHADRVFEKISAQIHG